MEYGYRRFYSPSIFETRDFSKITIAQNILRIPQRIIFFAACLPNTSCIIRINNSKGIKKNSYVTVQKGQNRLYQYSLKLRGKQNIGLFEESLCLNLIKISMMIYMLKFFYGISRSQEQRMAIVNSFYSVSYK